MKNKYTILLMLCMFLGSLQLLHAESVTLDSFRKLAVMENGRIKPFDTFALNILKQFSGRAKLKGQKAYEWMARVVLAPETTVQEKVFLITNPEVLDSIGIKQAGKARDRYSYQQLLPGINRLQMLVMSLSRRDAKQRGIIENEIIGLYNKIYVYRQLTHSFTFLDKHAVFSADIHANLPFTVIPVAGDQKWISTWDSFILNGKDIRKAKELILLGKIHQSFRAADQAGFDRAVSEFNRLILGLNSDFSQGKIDLEVFYNRLDPFYKAKFFFGFSVLFLLLSYMYFRKWFYRLSLLLLGGGFLLSLFGTVARMIIRSRPPVTNLYETFIFTGLITALLGMLLEYFKKRNIGVLTGSLAGFVMLMIAGKYAAEGDTMGMLVAVLDSNFWLAVHVITIILGYAGIVLSGFIGHLYILQRIFKPKHESGLKDTFQAVYSIQAFGIVFTFLGTVLGGIWADQSWGRFWGWDPKENGALLILLWSAILFHAKLAKMIRPLGYAFGTVIGVIFVALAWFGVNLLGVGLHSYGFTSGVARTLFLFIALELVFIFITGSMIRFGAVPGGKPLESSDK